MLAFAWRIVRGIMMLNQLECYRQYNTRRSRASSLLEKKTLTLFGYSHEYIKISTISSRMFFLIILDWLIFRGTYSWRGLRNEEIPGFQIGWGCILMRPLLIYFMHAKTLHIWTNIVKGSDF